MPSLHVVNMKVLKYVYPSKKVCGYCFGIYTPSVALCSDPLHHSPVVNLPLQILRLLTHRCNHAAQFLLKLALNIKKIQQIFCYQTPMKFGRCRINVSSLSADQNSSNWHSQVSCLSSGSLIVYCNNKCYSHTFQYMCVDSINCPH